MGTQKSHQRRMKDAAFIAASLAGDGVSAASLTTGDGGASNDISNSTSGSSQTVSPRSANSSGNASSCGGDAKYVSLGNLRNKGQALTMPGAASCHGVATKTPALQDPSEQPMKVDVGAPDRMQ